MLKFLASAVVGTSSVAGHQWVKRHIKANIEKRETHFRMVDDDWDYYTSYPGCIGEAPPIPGPEPRCPIGDFSVPNFASSSTTKENAGMFFQKITRKGCCIVYCLTLRPE